MDSLISETAHMSIYLSSYTSDNSHYNTVRDKLIQNIQKDLPTFKEEHLSQITNEERIALFQKYFEWVPIPSKFLQRLQKSSETSTHFRESGDQDFSKGCIPSALRSYNLSLAFAPQNSKEQLLAYFSRSGILAKISEFKLAFQDILRVENPQQMELLNEAIKQELDERKQFCETSLSKDGMANFMKNKEWEQGTTYCREKLSIKKPNKFLLGAEQCVKMEWDESSGRRLVAVEDIPAGTLLLMDSPYATLLDGLLIWDTEHCANCTKPLLAGIPDLESTFSMYCNEGCRSRSQNLPNSILTYLHLSSTLRDALLPLTVLYNAPPESLTCPEEQEADEMPGINSVYDPTSYSSVANLVQHRQNYDFSSLLTTPPNEFKALFLSNLISVLDPNHAQISPILLLKHLENLPYSQITLSSWRVDSIGSLTIPYYSTLAKKTEASISNSAYASAIFNLIALVNNSCDPNAFFFKNCRTTPGYLLSCKKIEKGSEICMSYRGHWSGIGVEERNSYLQTNYCFDCKCSACQDNLGPESVVGCEVITGGEEDENFLIEIEEELDEAVYLINNEKYVEALQIIVECCDKLTRFDGRFQLCVFAQTLLRRVVLHLCML